MSLSLLNRSIGSYPCTDERKVPTSSPHNKGAHFAAWEEPELFSAEVRAAFRSLRTNGGTHE
jgi:hypothetical protein